MGFYEVVFLITVVFVLIYFVVHSYLLIKYERKKLDILRDIRSDLLENDYANDYIVNWLDNLETKFDTFDLTDFTD